MCRPLYKEGHLPGAINHPVWDGTLHKAIPSPDKGKTCLNYCLGETPAIAGATELIGAGFDKVFRLEGGY